MKLQTKELLKFNSVAGQMKPNNSLPILSYLKFEDGIITKSNLESFVTMEADFKGSFLIDEKILMSFVNSISADEVDIKINDNSVTISHGKEKMISPTEPLINFPAISSEELDNIEFSDGIMSAIKTSINFTVENDSVPFAQCVFIGNGLIGATTGHIAYIEKTEEQLPEIVIERNVAAAIKNFNTISFSQNDRYQFFTNHIFKFGFVKKETKYINLNPFVKLPKEEKIMVNKSEIIKFCDACVSSSKSNVIIASIVNNKLSMVDANYGLDYEKPLSVNLKDFTFNPALMGKMLKSLPDESVYFIRDKAKYYVTGDSGFVSLIMEMQEK